MSSELDALLFQASLLGDLQQAKLMIGAKVDVNAIYQIGEVEAFPLYISAQNGHAEVVKLLLDNGAKVDAKLNTDGATALYIAALNGHTKIVELLLKHNANIESTVQTHTPLYAAIYNTHLDTVKLLLNSGATSELDQYRFTPLFIAARTLKENSTAQREIFDIVINHYWHNIQHLVQNSSSLNLSHNHSFLECSAHPEFITPNIPTDFEIVIVRYNESAEFLSSLIQKEFPKERVMVYNKNHDSLALPNNAKEIKISNTGYLGGTYLQHIVNNYENLAARTLFIQAFPYDHSSLYPLIRHKYATYSSCKNIIAKCCFIEKLGDISSALVHYKWENDPLFHIMTIRNYNMLEFMSEFKIGEQYDQDSKIAVNYGAAFAIDRDKIRAKSIEFYRSILNVMDSIFPLEDHYLERLWDVIFESNNKASYYNDSLNELLCLVAQSGNTQQAEALILQSANVNFVHAIGSTPLYIATQNGHAKIVELFLNKDANIEFQHFSGSTSLYIAVNRNDIELVQIFLQYGANTEIQVSGMSMLYLAVLYEYQEVVQLLLQYNTNPNASFRGINALYTAAKYGYVGIVEMLIKAGVNIQEAQANGKTALDIAAENNHPKAVQLLLDNGANIGFSQKQVFKVLFTELKQTFSLIDKENESIIANNDNASFIEIAGLSEDYRNIENCNDL